jgi:hypothetical protein
MRSVKIPLALASLSAFVALSSCTLITDVDRSKIPPDGGTALGEGGSDAGGSVDLSGAAGVGAEAGAAGVAGATP